MKRSGKTTTSLAMPSAEPVELLRAGVRLRALEVAAAAASFDLEELLGGMFGGGGGRGGSPFGGGRGRARAQKGSDVRAEITVPFTVAIEGGEASVTIQQGAKSERLSIRIPAGIDDGQTIRLAGQGSPGAGGGSAGDLLVTVHIAPHPWFRREGQNLLVDVPVTPSEAALVCKN